MQSGMIVDSWNSEFESIEKALLCYHADDKNIDIFSMGNEGLPSPQSLDI